MKKSIWAILILLIFAALPPNISMATQLSATNPVTAKSGISTEQSLYKEKEDAIAVFNNESKTISVSAKDVDLMAKVVYAESNAEPYEGKVAVASVILNRLKNKEFPKSIEGVIKQKDAFSCVVNGNISAFTDTDCYNAVFDALEGKDPTSKALYFYNPQISKSDWMDKIKKYNLKHIGKHVFFIA
jgi:N-acetylmuramoyl-L-alanine amidase